MATTFGQWLMIELCVKSGTNWNVSVGNFIVQFIHRLWIKVLELVLNS